MRIIANSLPKSGTHLLTRLLELLGYHESRLNLAGGMVRVTSRNPVKRLIKRKRVWQPGDKMPGLSVDLDDLNNKVKKDWLQKQVNQPDDKTFFKGHLPYSDPVRQFLAENHFKVLYIIRDPRDIVVSYCNHILKDKTHPFYKTFSALSEPDRIDFVLQGYGLGTAQPFASLRQRITNSIGWADVTDLTCTLRFEDLIGPKGGGDGNVQSDLLNKICAFLEMPPNDAIINDLAANVFYTGSKTFHKGLIGQWKTVLDDAAVSRIHKECGNYMERFGYDR